MNAFFTDSTAGGGNPGTKSKVAASRRGQTIVTVLSDTGKRYNSTGMLAREAEAGSC